MPKTSLKKDQTPNAKVFNIVLPNDLVERVDKISKDEYRNRSETIREALRNYVDQNSAGRKLHGLSAQSRESGNPVKALELNESAMVAYANDNDKLGFAEIQADRAITLSHLAKKTTDSYFHQGYLILARNASKSAVELAEKSGDKTTLAVPYVRLGKAYEDLGELRDALEAYKKAVENITNNPPENHNRAAIIADFKIHLESIAYLLGDKSALERLEKAIKDLEKVEVISNDQFDAQNKKLEFNQEAPYNYNVWLSGAHMRMAEILKNDDPKKAKTHLEKAREIIDSDSRLILRKTQWEKLAKSLQN